MSDDGGGRGDIKGVKGKVCVCGAWKGRRKVDIVMVVVVVEGREGRKG